VLTYPGAIFDFYVGENSVEVVAVKGKVSFVHAATDAGYDVSAGSPSIVADQNQVSSGEGTVDPDWDRWNTTRENFWAAKARVKGRSAEYLPPSLQPEAYALEENGRWERVPYEGSSRWFWRPTTVAVGWSPFTVGRWTEWDGDQCWIPAEPFGYITHHYGNWVYAGNAWYWAPPVASVRIGLPLLNVGFFWYPGRVSWIHSGMYVGWVPLAPRETYYSHRHWGGPHTVVVTNVNIALININVRNYAYANHAVVVNQNNFYRVNNYRNVRVTNINSTTIINNYRAAPVVNDTVINNYTTNKQRFNYTNVAVNEKPHNAVINRIRQNETIIRGAKKENAAVVQERAKGISEGKVNREARIEPPKITNYIVPANEVNRPKSEIKLPQREIKSAGRGVPPAQPAQVVVPQHVVAPARPGQARQVVVPQHATPAQPEHPSQAVVPKHVTPARPGQIGKVAIPEHSTPVKPGQKKRPGQTVVPRHVAPAQPGQSATVVVPEHVLPATPSQPPQRVQVGHSTPHGAQHEAPTKQAPPSPASQPAAPALTPAAQTPARAVQPSQASPPQQPAAKPARVTPPEPAGPPERTAPAEHGRPDKHQDDPRQQERSR
jgi:hypothetical protein